MTYKIIGGDQKEYGPISAEQLRQWVAEGRANAQTLAQSEGSAEWKPLSSFIEFAGLFGGLPAPAAPTLGLPLPAGAVGAPPPPEAVLSRDYDLDIGDCISRSWALLQRHFWPVVGISLLVWIIQFAFSEVISLFTRAATHSFTTALIQEHRVEVIPGLIMCSVWLVTMPLNTLMLAGLYNYYLKLIRGQTAGIGDAFSGFGPSAGHLLLLGFVNGLLTLLGLAFCILPGIFLSVSWIFSMPLVIDRGMGFWDAMEFSRKAVAKHWFMVFALLIVVGLLALAGALACCIGVLVAVPLGWIALMYAYEDIFSRPAP